MLYKYALVKLLKAVLEEPETPLTLRQLAAKAGTSPSAAKAGIDWMTKQGMLSKNRVGNAVLHKPRLDSPLTRQWKILFNLQALTESGLLDKLSSLPGVSSLVLYGSAAHGTNDSKSDIDILVIASERKKIRTSEYAAKLGREVNVSTFTPSEWRSKAKTSKVFYEQVIINSIALFGKKPVVL